jgi:uncharacterized membrane protein
MDGERISFEACLRQAFALYKDHFLLLLLTHITLVGVSVFSLGILAGPMMVGVVRIVLGLLDDRSPSPQPGDIFDGLRFFLPSLLLGLAVGVASAVAARVLGLLLIGPLALLLGPILPLAATVFAFFMIAERGMDFWSALQAGWTRVKPVFWPVAGLVAIGWAVSLLGLLAFYCGVVLTLPFYTCLTAVLWRRMEGTTTPP